jgi:hemolysin activation/secretion protein
VFVLRSVGTTRFIGRQPRPARRGRGRPIFPLRCRAIAAALIAVVGLAVHGIAAAITFTVSRFEVSGDNPIGASRTESILAPFTGDHDGLDRLELAARTLENAIRERGFTFYRVIVPPQAIRDGVIRLEVQEFVLGKVTVEGNEHFSEQNILRTLPGLEPGASPRAGSLARSLAVANLGPAKRARLRFGAGTEPGTVDARIDVRDRNPRRLYAWLNNTGNDATGDTRLGVGLQHANLFDRDHVVTATYTTSPEEPDRVDQYGLNYQVPLYRPAGILSLYGIHSDVDSGVVAEVFDIRGGGDILGIGYSQVLPKVGPWRQRLDVGIEDKVFDNDIRFDGEPIGVDVRSRPVSLNHRGEWESARSQGHVYGGAFVNTSGGDHNDAVSYAASRAGADEDWSLFRAGAQAEVTLGEWLLNTRIDGQYADEPLIPGEQLGAGGMNSVRGFEERELTADRGYRGSVVLWGPTILNRLRLGAFVDGARLERLNPQAGEFDDETIASTGLVLNWQHSRRLTMLFHWGHVFEGVDEPVEGTRDGDDKFHFNVMVQFL